MKDTFIIYTESKELVDELSVHQKAALLDALFTYAVEEEIDLSDIDLTTRIVFKTMRMKIDAANERYEEKCRVNKENGARGGRPKTERFGEETEKTERLFLETQKTLPDTDTDTETEPEDKRKAPTEPKEKRTRFTPPTVEEVEAYAREKGLNIPAERFVDFYASKGWKVGNAPMKDWKAAARNWAARDKPAGKDKDRSANPLFEHERAIREERKLFRDYDLSSSDYSKLLYKRGG